MDVYFATLKYESVEQLKGYEVLNFLSKSTMKYFKVSDAYLIQYELPPFDVNYLCCELSKLISVKHSNRLYWCTKEARL